MNRLMNFELVKTSRRWNGKQGSATKEMCVMAKRFVRSFKGGSLAMVCLALAAAGVVLLPMQAFAQQLTPAWVFGTVAGNGTSTGNTGDNGPALSAEIAKPFSVVRDKAGNLYISNSYQQIRKVDTNGIITTVAGTSESYGGFAGDGGPATAALFNNPYGLALDNNGNLLVADEGNSIIRRIDMKTGIITTIAGTPNVAGFSGDGGPATSAELHAPYTVSCDAAGNIYIADYSNYRIRKVDTKGIITTFAGKGISGNTGNGGPATSAELQAYSVVADLTGDVYFADPAHQVVRMVDPHGIIHAVAGTGTVCSIITTPTCLDGGPATSARLDGPHGVTTDGMGNVYFIDESTHDARLINPAGIVNKIAGTYGKGGSTGDGGPANNGKLYYPYNIIIDSSNNLYIANASSGTIRILSQNTGQPATDVASSATQNLFVQSTAAVTPTAATISP
ncbi:MAG: hypothetical protein ABI142_14130, partial [Bryocella sp.]